MATQLFLGNSSTQAQRARFQTGHNDTGFTFAFWTNWRLETARGSGVQALSSNTVAGPTAGVAVGASSETVWISAPVDADVSIAGAITGNFWASESNMSANVAINFVVDVIRATDMSIVEIARSTRTTEVAVTTRAVNNFTVTPGAAVTVNKGDRIRIRPFADDSTANMGSGFTFSLGWGGTSAGADGDSYVSFTETFGFMDETAAPGGSQVFLTDTASDIDPGSAVEKEAWTTRGGSAVTKATNTAAGWVAPIQWTDGAGGSAIEWYTKALNPFTLTGLAKANLRLFESNAAANAGARCEIAVVNNDGSSPTVWCSWGISPTDTGSSIGELDTTQRAETFYLSGDDLSVAGNQRLRFRVYLDDSAVQLVTGQTATLAYNGPTAAASGDSYITLAQTISEYVAPVFTPWRSRIHQLIAQ